MKKKIFLSILSLMLFSTQVEAQFGFGADFNTSNFQLTSEKYSTFGNTYLDLNVFYFFNQHYGVQSDFKYLTQGAVLNNVNFDIDFFQIPLYLIYSIGNDKKINYQINIGYYLKLPINVSNNMSKDFYNHGATCKFSLVYEISKNIRCLSGLEFSKDINTTYSNKDLKFSNYGVLFGLQILPFN